MDRSSADLLVVLAMVTALLVGLAIGWREARANADWQTAPMVHAADGPVLAR